MQNARRTTSHLFSQYLVRATDKWLEEGVNSRAEPSSEGAFVLRYGRRFRIVFCACVIGYVIICALPVAPFVRGELPLRMLLLAEGVFGGFGLMSLACPLQFFRRSVHLDENGFVLHRVIFAPVRVAWKDLESIRYSPLLQVLKIYRKHGRCIWLSTCMNGLGTFRAYLIRFAPHVVDKACRAGLPRALTPARLTPRSTRAYNISRDVAWKRKR